MYFVAFLVQMFSLIFLFIFSAIVFSIILRKSALLISFKGEFYKEYQQWQAFKKYLSHSFTIKAGTYKTVKMWDHYLVYATALGVPKKVIKELKHARIIDTKQYNLYMGLHATSVSFATSSGR